LEQIEFFEFFHDISPADYNLLINNLRTKTYKKGDFIIVEGQTQQDLYFVKSGVQMSYFNADNKTHVLSFTYPLFPCLVPESFLFQTPSKYFLTCLSDSEMGYISYEGLQKLFDQSQQLENVFSDE
jgi:cAMP-binding proteins - catabolite gene activator and regulatory subunit of cAMP-dependent protein kinases